MRFIGSVYGVDSRPEKVEGKKAPKGGWRTKSGRKRLGKKAAIEADTLTDAAAKIVELIGKLKPATQAQIVRLNIDVDTSDPSTGSNPFGA